MSSIEGKLITCDLCGTSVFLKYLGKREADGGFTTWREYEKLPNGWNAISVRGYDSLCPACSAQIAEAINEKVDEIMGGQVSSGV